MMLRLLARSFVLVAFAAPLAGCRDVGGSPWQRTELDSGQFLSAYAGADGTVWAGTRLGTLLRGRSAGELQAVPLGGLDAVNAIHGSEPGTVWVGTDHGHLYQVTGDQAQEVDSPTTDSIEALWVFSASDIIVVSVTRVFRGSPDAWTEIVMDITPNLVWAIAADDVWFFDGAGTTFAHLAGSTLEAIDPGIAGLPLWYDVWGSGREWWLLGADAGRGANWILHYDGGFSSEYIEIDEGIGTSYAIAGASPQELYRVGASGFTARYDGSEWTTIPAVNTIDTLTDVVVTGSEVLAFSDHGVVWTMPR